MTMYERASKRVLGAKTVSAKLDGETVERLDAYVAARAAEHGAYSRADVIRSALTRFFEAVDALDPPQSEAIDGSAIEIKGDLR